MEKCSQREATLILKASLLILKKILKILLKFMKNEKRICLFQKTKTENYV